MTYYVIQLRIYYIFYLLQSDSGLGRLTSMKVFLTAGSAMAKSEKISSLEGLKSLLVCGNMLRRLDNLRYS